MILRTVTLVASLLSSTVLAAEPLLEQTDVFPRV